MSAKRFKGTSPKPLFVLSGYIEFQEKMSTQQTLSIERVC